MQKISPLGRKEEGGMKNREILKIEIPDEEERKSERNHFRGFSMTNTGRKANRNSARRFDTGIRISSHDTFVRLNF